MVILLQHFFEGTFWFLVVLFLYVMIFEFVLN